MSDGVVHLVRNGGGEYPQEDEYILCDSKERYMDPKATFDNEHVTCKRCLKILDKELRQFRAILKKGSRINE